MTKKERLERAKLQLKLGADYPYDLPDNERKPKNFDGDWAVTAARGVISDLTDRNGIKHGFDEVDEEIRAEIVQRLADIIRLAYVEGQ